MDSGTNRVYVGEPASPQRVYVIDPATNSVMTTIGMGSVSGLGVNSSTHRLYATNPSGNTVSVVDETPGSATEHQVIATVGVGSGPSSLDVDATTNRIYVANSSARTLSVIDGATQSVVATVALAATSGSVGTSDGVAVNSNTHRIYVNHEQGNVLSIVEDLPAPDLQIVGKIAFNSNWEIYAMNADGTGQTNLTNNPSIDDVPSWSPDGMKIAFVSGRDGNQDVYVMNADGTGQTRLTDNTAQEFYPSWSPDGTKIAFGSGRDGNQDVYVMNADGTNQTRLTNNTALDGNPSWSPDGTKIAFHSNRDGNYEIYVMNADGTGQTNLTNNTALDAAPSWSPDGTTIAFSSDRDGSHDIYVMNADGTGQTNLTNNTAGNGEPSWSPDGTTIVFHTDLGNIQEIYRISTAGTKLTRLTNNAVADYSPSWAPFQRIGFTAVGTPISQTMKIKNTGSGNLTVINITSSDGQFSANPTNFTVAPGDSQGVAVSFNPTTSGTKYATLTISSNDPDTPTAKLVVNGTGHGIATSVPDTVSSYNQVVSVPVRVSDTSGEGVVAGEVNLVFNGDVLSVFSVGTSSTLMSGWTVQSNVVQGNATVMDTLKIAAAHTTALSGAGTLLNVRFQMGNVRHPATSPLTLSQVVFNTGSVVTSLTNGSLKVVGNNGSIVSFPATVIPRWSVGVTVSDVDENRNVGVAEVRSVRVSNGSQTETVVVTETGLSTGVFSGSIGTVFSLAPTSGDGVVQAKAGDVIVFAFDDSLDSTGNTVVRRDTTNVIGGKDGHLRVTVVSQPGDTVRVRLTDMDLNTNPGTVQSTTVNGVNVRTGESEVLMLTEKSANDSIFFGTVRTTLGSTAGTNNDGVFKAQKGDTLRVSYADTLTLQGGYATVIDQNKAVNPFGDADGNGQVQAFDAARVLFHVLSPFLIGIDSLSANVDLLAPFGQISPFDASLILQKRVGLISRFPVQEKQSDNQPQPETGLSKPVVGQRVLSLAQGEGYWSVMADERGGILSGDLVLSEIEGKVELGPELQEYLIASRDGEGSLRIVFAGAVSVSGPGELLRVYPGVGPGSAQLTRAELNDGQLGVVLSGVASTAAIPTTFALLANYPNPFNPETTIGFALPQRSLVTLAVYDVLGQQIRLLVGRELPAGQHQVVWDGRDEMGRQVSSGVYMYRLQAGSFSQLKRMVMIK